MDVVLIVMSCDVVVNNRRCLNRVCVCVCIAVVRNRRDGNRE